MLMTENKHTGYYNYTVEARDTDSSDRATYVALCDYIIRVAGDDADIRGFGVRKLNNAHWSWVLSRMCVEFTRRPRQGEHLIVRNWLSDVNRIMATRNMEIRDSENRLLTAAVTQWAMIDLDKRCAVDVTQSFDYSTVIEPDPCPIEKPRRIRTATSDTSFTRKVCYSDLDFNGHVGSVKYLQWMLDMVPVEFITERGLARLDINYHHEAVIGQQLLIGYQQSEDSSTFEITSADDNRNVCKAVLQWK